MNKSEYKQQQEIIVKQYGLAEWDVNGKALNESAKRLQELRQAYYDANRQAKKNEELAKKAARLQKKYKPVIEIPEQLISPAWLVSFTDAQKLVIAQWIKDVEQSPKQIADTLNITVGAVKAVLSLEAFKMLRTKLTYAYKDMLPLSAMAVFREMMLDPNTPEAVRKDIAKTLLQDAGFIKAESIGIDVQKINPILDAEAEEKLKKMGDDILGLGDNK